MSSSISNIITFNGEERSWRIWKTQYLAKATINGHKKILLGKVKPQDAAIDDTHLSKEELFIRRLHEVVFCELLLAMKSNKCLQLVSESVTNELPKGCAKTA